MEGNEFRNPAEEKAEWKMEVTRRIAAYKDAKEKGAVSEDIKASIEDALVGSAVVGSISDDGAEHRKIFTELAHISAEIHGRK